MTSAITDIPPAPSSVAQAHFAARLSLETDCWDVHDAHSRGAMDFVLLDVRSPALFAAGHLPGAINLPRGKMTDARLREWPDGTVFVVYCAGPHCNGADKAALRLAQARRPVKLMIGGITGWLDEGFTLTTA